jgi:hypothetical protein
VVSRANGSCKAEFDIIRAATGLDFSRRSGISRFTRFSTISHGTREIREIRGQILKKEQHVATRCRCVASRKAQRNPCKIRLVAVLPIFRTYISILRFLLFAAILSFCPPCFCRSLSNG